MAESSTESNKFQWKWVGITFGLYVVFYLLPILIVGGAFSQSLGGRILDVFFGTWFFAGIIIIAAVAGYLSKGVTLWEPTVAGLGLVVLVFGFIITQVLHKFSVFRASMTLLVMMLTVFLLSLVGAWLGERAQKIWKTKPPEST